MEKIYLQIFHNLNSEMGLTVNKYFARHKENKKKYFFLQGNHNFHFGTKKKRNIALNNTLYQLFIMLEDVKDKQEIKDELFSLNLRRDQ